MVFVTRIQIIYGEHRFYLGVKINEIKFTCCANGDCARTYDDGGKVNFQAQRKFNQFTGDWKFNSEEALSKIIRTMLSSTGRAGGAPFAASYAVIEVVDNLPTNEEQALFLKKLRDEATGISY